MRTNIMTVSFSALCLAAPRGAWPGGTPPGSAADAALEAQVREALAKELGPAGTELTVEARDGIVRLGGIAAEADTRQRAEHIAGSVSGVARVSVAGLVVRAATPCHEDR